MIGSFRIAAVVTGISIGVSTYAAQKGKQTFSVAVPSAPASAQMLLTLENVVFPSSQSAILRSYLTRRNTTPVFLGSTTIVAVSGTAQGDTHYRRLAIPLSQFAARRIRESARRDTVHIEITPVDGQRHVLKNVSWTVSRVALTRAFEK